MSFDGAVPVGAIGGVRIRVHLSFLALIGLLSFQIYQQVGLIGALWMWSRIGLIVLCFLVHELGHAFAAKFLGVRVFDIVLGPFGGMARLEALPVDPKVELWISAAGPGANLAFLALLLPIQALDGGSLIPTGGVLQWSALEFTLVIHAVMGTVNLIPAFPMDGGRILRAALSRRIGFDAATRAAVHIGRGIGLAAMIPALFDRRMLAIALVGAFIWYSGSRELRMRRASADRAANTTPRYGDGDAREPAVGADPADARTEES